MLHAMIRMDLQRMRLIRWVLGAGLCMLALGCGDAAGPMRASDDQVLILAAASTQDALEQVAAALRARGGPSIIVSPAGSNALAQQILAGAPGDLFLSAHPAWTEQVVDRGHAIETVRLLGGQLVLVTPANNPANIRTPRDLLDARVRRIALAGEHVPAGMYAEQALRAHELYERLSASGGIVRGQNVRFALAYVQRGEAEAGIVYASDAAVAADVRVGFTFDAADHDPIIYPLVLLTRGGDRAAARAAFELLQSAEAGAIFQRHGFQPLNESTGSAR